MSVKKIAFIVILAGYFLKAFAVSNVPVSFEPITSIAFSKNSSVLQDWNKKLLDDVSHILSKNPNDKIMLIGNTDGTVKKGDPLFNIDLARERVKTIKNYLLLQKALSSNRLEIYAFADTPMLCNSPRNSLLARRVDIVYCRNNDRCQNSFDKYKSWLKNHCSFPIPFDANFSTERRNYKTNYSSSFNSKYALTVSYAIPRAWSEAPRAISTLKFSDGTNLGDFNSYRTKSSQLVDLDLSTRLFFSKSRAWFNPFYLGLDVWSNLGTVTAQGEFIYDRLLPANHYDYQYQIATKGAGLSGKLYLYNAHRLEPYLYLGLGATQLVTSNFLLTPLNDADPTTLYYPGKTKTNFYYKAALGFDFVFSKHFKMGANYFYSDLGKYSIGPGELNIHRTPTINKRLTVDGFTLSAGYNF
ncbi:MAG: OmpA family protein [Gammaproteobacteria bacterium]|nr:OmpA family protein [Gammaproteobacteria bacterium]